MAYTFVAFILATQALSEPNDSCTEPTESSFLQHRGKLTTAPVGSFTNAFMQDKTYWEEACGLTTGCLWCHDFYQKTRCDDTAQVVLFVYSQWWIDPAQQLPQHSQWDSACGGWMLAPENTPTICGGGVANAPAEANALFGKIVSPLSDAFPYKPGGATEAGMIVVAPHISSFFHFFDIEYFGGQCMVLQAWARVFTLGNWLGISDFAYTQKITVPGTPGEQEMKWPCMQPSWTDWGGIWPENWQKEVQMESCQRWHNLREKYGNGKAILCSQIQVEELYKELSSWDLASFLGKGGQSCTNAEMCLELCEQDVQKEIEKGLRISYYPQAEAPSEDQWKEKTYSCRQSDFAKKWLKDYAEMPEDKLSGWEKEV